MLLIVADRQLRTCVDHSSIYIIFLTYANMENVPISETFCMKTPVQKKRDNGGIVLPLQNTVLYVFCAQIIFHQADTNTKNFTNMKLRLKAEMFQVRVAEL